MQLDRSFNLDKHFDEKYPEVFAKNMVYGDETDVQYVELSKCVSFQCHDTDI